MNDETKALIIDLYKATYYDFNITHFTEYLNDVHKIKVCSRSVRTYLLESNIISPKAHRLTKRLLKKKLKAELESSNKKNKVQINNSLKILDYPDVHPRKPRAKYFGEQLQMDASDHVWFGSSRSFLHSAIDDHSGMIVGAYFDTQETIKGYFNVLKQILETYGIPAQFFTDKRTIFEYKKAPSKKEDTYTQFAYATHQLGIELKSSSVPQAKGRIERSYNTLQSRLKAEMRLNQIETIEQANLFLATYIIHFNNKFALDINNSISVFENKPLKQELDDILVVRNSRVIDSGHSVKYNNKILIPIDKNGKPVYFRNKTKCLVIKTLDEKLFVNVDDKLYLLDDVGQHSTYSPEFDQKEEKKPFKVNIPKMSHPWKQASYEAFVLKQKHRSRGTHVSTF